MTTHFSNRLCTSRHKDKDHDAGDAEAQGQLAMEQAKVAQRRVRSCVQNFLVEERLGESLKNKNCHICRGKIFEILMTHLVVE